MKKSTILIIAFVAAIIFILSCSKDPAAGDRYAEIRAAFGDNINPNNLSNYASQGIPTYITKDNTRGNNITDAKATLGRVLFYDKNLSINNTVACGSCHQQKFAFSDTAVVSSGVEGGVTARHSMRLINSRFANELAFFWNERAASLEIQTTMPIQDHAEMGYSGTNGRPGLAVLLNKLQGVDYYNELFKFVYGDVTITEARMQECLAQFVRSIQSFDSKYDAGRAVAQNDNVSFSNFTVQENNGKSLFLTAPVFDAQSNRIAGGLGCNACHRAPEFDIDPNSGNNGIIGTINAAGIDINNTRAPSLRDLVNPAGVLNTPLMHTAVIPSLQAAIGHYGTITPAAGNTRLDQRLKPNGVGQKLNLTAQDVNSVLAFLRTLSGNNVYTDVKWSNPFQ